MKNAIPDLSRSFSDADVPAQNFIDTSDPHLSFLYLPSEKSSAPLLICFHGLDETGQDLISLEMNDCKRDFDVCGLIVPADDWSKLAAQAIIL